VSARDLFLTYIYGFYEAVVDVSTFDNDCWSCCFWISLCFSLEDGGFWDIASLYCDSGSFRIDELAVSFIFGKLMVFKSSL
tara:strand:+ start:2123 stop:2365 length:243 start_codon:yes stop_codon:yes gene_type:complete